MIFKIDCTSDCYAAAYIYPELKKFVSGIVRCNEECSPFYKMIGKIVEIRTGKDRYDVYVDDNDIELLIDFDMDMEVTTINKVIDTLKSKGIIINNRDELRRVAMTYRMVDDVLFGLITEKYSNNYTERG